MRVPIHGGVMTERRWSTRTMRRPGGGGDGASQDRTCSEFMRSTGTTRWLKRIAFPGTAPEGVEDGILGCSRITVGRNRTNRGPGHMAGGRFLNVMVAWRRDNFSVEDAARDGTHVTEQTTSGVPSGTADGVIPDGDSAPFATRDADLRHDPGGEGVAGSSRHRVVCGRMGAALHRGFGPPSSAQSRLR